MLAINSEHPFTTDMSSSPKGRGSGLRPQNRFESSRSVEDLSDWDSAPDREQWLKRRVDTQFLPDKAASIITKNTSPDIPFTYSLNPYRGCEHGCAYCYARPTHEYLGFNAGIDFESKIMVKHEAPRLLEETMSSPRWEPATLAMSGVTDCYQPVERRLGITRACLGVLAHFRNPVGIVTKNALVTRDIDLLQEMNQWRGCAVMITITSLDADLARKLEPRAASPRQRLETIQQLATAGIPVGVMTAPVIPGLNDEEIPEILKQAAEHGATSAGHVLLRLPWSVEPVFLEWLQREYPSKKDRILQRLRDLRGGELYQSNFGERMTGQGIWAETFKKMFALGVRRAGIAEREHVTLNTNAFRPLGGKQMTFF